MTRTALLFVLLAGGCASSAPAPVSYGASGAQQQAPARVGQASAPDDGGAPIEYRAGAQAPRNAPPAATPAPGQPPPAAAAAAPAPDWADGEGTPLSAYALRPEDAQPFDPAHLPRSHRVGENETLYDIATRYQAPLRALIEQNHLEAPYALTPGRELQLPPPRFHTVVRGETLEDVAQRYNVDPRSLALLNRMQAPYRVSAGDRIALPALARAAAFASDPPRQNAAAPPAMAADARFVLPLRGAVVAHFGVQPGGARLDGLEIAGREGDAINAAADGEVVYAGADLPAYGTLVLVRHGDNYVTAYGFTRRALVREGQRVRAGEQIAELGSRPDGRARLLFQVRHGSAAIDPTPLLGTRD